ncbi:MAG: hypothetical protein ACI8Q2_000667 [Candidatus Omnitrophota bacterium]|jgi:hypothetical protein
MKIIVMRICGGILIFMGLNVLLCGLWFNVQNKMSISTYKASKKTIIYINDQVTSVGFKELADTDDFNIGFDQFKDKISQYHITHVDSNSILPYILSAFALCISILYISSGIGILYFRQWALKIGIIGASLLPLFYIFILSNLFKHVSFLDKVIIDMRNLLSYLQTENAGLAALSAYDIVIPRVIMIAIITFLFFVIAPLWFFFTPSVQEELS